MMKRKKTPVTIVNCLSMMYIFTFIIRASISIGHNALTILIHTYNIIQNYKTKYIDIIFRALEMFFFFVFDISDICCYTVYVVIYWMSLYSRYTIKTDLKTV